MIIAVTGHRADKLDNTGDVFTFLRNVFHVYEATKVICGMANGTDLIGGLTAVMMDIPLIAAKPWAGHGPRKGDEESYACLIDNAVEVVNVVDAQEYPGPWAYQRRNEWMVDRCDMLAGVWDGSTGGTKNCISYGIARQTPLIYLNPITREVMTNI